MSAAGWESVLARAAADWAALDPVLPDEARGRLGSALERWRRAGHDPALAEQAAREVLRWLPAAGERPAATAAPPGFDADDLAVLLLDGHRLVGPLLGRIRRRLLAAPAVPLDELARRGGDPYAAGLIRLAGPDGLRLPAFQFRPAEEPGPGPGAEPGTGAGAVPGTGAAAAPGPAARPEPAAETGTGTRTGPGGGAGPAPADPPLPAAGPGPAGAEAAPGTEPAAPYPGGVAPWPVVCEINAQLGAEDDPWGAADWWLSPNAWLAESPAALLGRGQDARLRDAAHDLTSGE